MSKEKIDILENTLRRHGKLLSILLIDRTRTTSRKTHNILWATDSYKGHKATNEIQLKDVTGKNTTLIQPRIVKSKEEQKKRTKDKAEVFTSKDIVCDMVNQINWDDKRMDWPVESDNWQEYVQKIWLEVACGEAPFIVGRYNAVRGRDVIDPKYRNGFLDRKMRVIRDYCQKNPKWLKWTKIAFQSSYGYEWQGDNLLLARENLLYTFIDYWNARFPQDRINLERQVAKEKLAILEEIATIISWNIFQMDGIKCVVPMSCKHEITVEDVPPMMLMLGEKAAVHKNECPGCKTGDPTRHNGKYAKIMNWQTGKTEKFVDALK